MALRRGRPGGGRRGAAAAGADLVRLRAVLRVRPGLGGRGAEIWAAYGESLGGPAALVGHGREEIFAGFTNVHNSYILWHKSMGVMAIPLYLLAALALVRALMRDWMLFVILAALLLGLLRRADPAVPALRFPLLLPGVHRPGDAPAPTAAVPAPRPAEA